MDGWMVKTRHTAYVVYIYIQYAVQYTYNVSLIGRVCTSTKQRVLGIMHSGGAVSWQMCDSEYVIKVNVHWLQYSLPETCNPLNVM